MSTKEEAVYDAHNYKPGCKCYYSWNGVLDDFEPTCPLLLEELRQAHETPSESET